MQQLETPRKSKDPLRRLLMCGGVLLVALAALQACAVVAVVDTVGTIAVKTAGLAADAAIGVVKISGKAVGAAADALVPDGK